MTITTGLELLDPNSYGQNGPPHEIWKRLRAESPVHWCEVPELEPFWAITRHEDIRSISRRPDLFISGKGITPLPLDPALNRNEGVASMKVVISTDPPEHRDLRKVATLFEYPCFPKRPG